MTDPTLFKDVADVNQDGFVNNADIQFLITLVADNINVSGEALPGSTVSGGEAGSTSSPPVTAVPEPATIVLLGLGALAIAIRRRAR